MPEEQVIEQDQQSQDSPEVDAQAREMGWRPKDEFKGAEEKWVDAKTFVERGEHVLPIVKATADRLRKENTALHNRQVELEAAVLDGQKAITALEKYHQDDVKQKVDKARADLREQLKVAIKEGDADGQADATVALSKLDAAETAAIDRDDVKGAATTTTSKPVPKDYTKEPEFIEWFEENPWFGKDKARSAIAYQVSIDVRNDNPNLKGKAFLDKVAEETAKEVTRLGGGRQAARKVEGGKGGAGGNSGGNGGGKTWADLPAEAKTACTSYEQDLVGPNRRYKSQADWRASYVKQYFTEV